MPLFTLQRNYVLRTTKGHSIAFKKGEPTWVPPMCVPDVVAIGALGDESNNVLGEEAGPPQELAPEERKAKILEAFDTLMLRSERGDFTASGLPHCKKLQSITGFEVFNKERDDAWQEYQKARSDATEQ